VSLIHFKSFHFSLLYGVRKSRKKETFFTPMQKLLLLIVAAFILFGLFDIKPKTFRSMKIALDSAEGWRIPDFNSLPYDSTGEIVRYGFMLFSKTSVHIGSDKPDSLNRFTGNNLSCNVCHLNNGLRKYGLGLVGVYSAYPKRIDSLDREITLQEKINQCVRNSLNGKEIPDSTRIMSGLLSYLKWMSSYIPEGEDISGHDLCFMPLRNSVPETLNGKDVYNTKCAICHNADGSGILNDTGSVYLGYRYPPVWGEHSFSERSSMNDLKMLSNFIRTKMDYGENFITNEEAWNVAGFLIMMGRAK
jgi:thiosulfate dehydrogenase